MEIKDMSKFGTKYWSYELSSEFNIVFHKYVTAILTKVGEKQRGVAMRNKMSMGNAPCSTKLWIPKMQNTTWKRLCRYHLQRIVAGFSEIIVRCNVECSYDFARTPWRLRSPANDCWVNILLKRKTGGYQIFALLPHWEGNPPVNCGSPHKYNNAESVSM